MTLVGDFGSCDKGQWFGVRVSSMLPTLFPNKLYVSMVGYLEKTYSNSWMTSAIRKNQINSYSDWLMKTMKLHVKLFEDNQPTFRTCVMSSVHSSVMVTHSVEVVLILLWEGQVGSLVVLPRGRLPGGWPCPQVQVPHALTPLHHVGGHVQSSQGETHQGWQLIPPLADLFQHAPPPYIKYMLYVFR